MSYHEGSNWQAKKEDNKEPLYPAKKWRRYRFETRSVDDYRPIVFNQKYPWWCSGYAGDGSTVAIIAYLPVDEDLAKYWDDAENISYSDHEKIEFSGRFPKPDYYQG